MAACRAWQPSGRLGTTLAAPALGPGTAAEHGGQGFGTPHPVAPAVQLGRTRPGQPSFHALALRLRTGTCGCRKRRSISARPSDRPSARPSDRPSARPSDLPFAKPFSRPSASPSDLPSALPFAVIRASNVPITLLPVLATSWQAGGGDDWWGARLGVVLCLRPSPSTCSPAGYALVSQTPPQGGSDEGRPLC